MLGRTEMPGMVAHRYSSPVEAASEPSYVGGLSMRT